MALSPELLAILACPRCKGDVEPTGEGSFLVCPACRLKYPVCDGIPLMLIEEAVRLDEE
jgi:uncharacterized protein